LKYTRISPLELPVLDVVEIDVHVEMGLVDATADKLLIGEEIRNIEDRRQCLAKLAILGLPKPPFRHRGLPALLP
jgi:hypothetical protein